MKATLKCIKCGLRYRNREIWQGNELTHCLKCRIIEDSIKGLAMACENQFDRKIKVTWEVIKK